MGATPKLHGDLPYVNWRDTRPDGSWNMDERMWDENAVGGSFYLCVGHEMSVRVSWDAEEV